MDIEGLKSFLAVAKTKSFSKAAEQIHVTQPTLSIRISKLEEGLGFKLLERNWQGVQLTKEGYYFLPSAIEFLQSIDNTALFLKEYVGEGKTSYEEVTNHKADRLYIGLDDWLVHICLDPIMDILASKYPNLNYKIMIKPSKAICDLINYSGLHIGVMYHNERDVFYETMTLVEDGLVMLHSESLDLSPYETESLRSLKFLLFDNPVLTYHSEVTKEIIGKLGIKNFQIVNNVDVMIKTLLYGGCYTILPRSAVHGQLAGNQYPLKVHDVREMFMPAKICMAKRESELLKDVILDIESALIGYFKTKYNR